MPEKQTMCAACGRKGHRYGRNEGMERHDKQACINGLIGEVERLRSAIERHRTRKHDYAAVHEKVGKYGCLDCDLRLWSVLDATG